MTGVAGGLGNVAAGAGNTVQAGLSSKDSENTGSDAAGETAEKTESMAGAVGGKTSETAGQAGQVASDTAGEAKDTVGGAAQESGKKLGL